MAERKRSRLKYLPEKRRQQEIEMIKVKRRFERETGRKAPGDEGERSKRKRSHNRFSKVNEETKKRALERKERETLHQQEKLRAQKRAKQRKQKSKKLRRRSAKGQPIMSNAMEHLVEKIIQQDKEEAQKK